MQCDGYSIVEFEYCIHCYGCDPVSTRLCWCNVFVLFSCATVRIKTALVHCHILTLKVLNFWKFTSCCSLEPLWSGMGGSTADSYLADPTSPIPSHCASIVATSTLRVMNEWMGCTTLYFLQCIMFTWQIIQTRLYFRTQFWLCKLHFVPTHTEKCILQVTLQMY